jgi:hypothetical protein
LSVSAEQGTTYSVVDAEQGTTYSVVEAETNTLFNDVIIKKVGDTLLIGLGEWPIVLVEQFYVANQTAVIQVIDSAGLVQTITANSEV